MTIHSIMVGGFGNRLYQIANMLRLQKIYNCNLKFYRVSATQNDVFNFRNLALRPSDFDDFGGHELAQKDNLPKNINQIFPTLDFTDEPTSINSIISDKRVVFEHQNDSIIEGEDCVVMGYYFGYRFVENQIIDLKNLFNKSIDVYINQSYPELENNNILGLHLRLGIGSDNKPAIGVPYEYYNHVINSEIDNFDTIFVVSDNVEKSKNFIYNLGIQNKTIRIIEDEPMFIDMMILSKCKILSIAPSTLSAWSAYFNINKNIYVPKIWTSHHWTNDIPKEWKLF
jgi:hypothetical protein